MKNFFLSLIPIVLVCFCVFGLSRAVQFKPWTKTGQEKEYKEFRRIIAMPTVEANAQNKPKVVCSESKFDFGIMSPFENGIHLFTISNDGDAPLVLKNGGKSCSCIDFDLSAMLLEPGESTDIEVRWSTDKPGKLAQNLNIRTNSPETPELQLWITGTVAATLDSSVTRFGFDSLLAEEIRSHDFHIYSDLWDEIVIDRIEASSEDVKCEKIQRSSTSESPLRITSNVEKPIEHKSRVDLRLTVKAQSTGGSRTEQLRIYVKPPQSDAEAEATHVKGLQPDGSILIELPVATRVIRRLSFYGPAIADGEAKLIDLGKIRTTSPAQDWAIVAKLRGDLKPNDMKVSLTGIEGVSATIEPLDSGVSYRINIHAEEKLRLGAYNRQDAGKLRIEADGLPGEELVEFKVELDVLEEN